MTNISAELLHVGFCNFVQVLWIICCLMWKRTRFLLLILPLISSIFFLSNFQMKKSSFFSQGLRGTQSWNLVHTWVVGWCIMYTWNGLLVFIYSFISSIFFLSNCKTFLYINILTYKKNMRFERFSCFFELDLLRIGDIRIGKNFHIWTKSNIMLTNID